LKNYNDDFNGNKIKLTGENASQTPQAVPCDAEDKSRSSPVCNGKDAEQNKYVADPTSHLTKHLLGLFVVCIFALVKCLQVMETLDLNLDREAILLTDSQVFLDQGASSRSVIGIDRTRQVAVGPVKTVAWWSVRGIRNDPSGNVLPLHLAADERHQILLVHLLSAATTAMWTLTNLFAKTAVLT